MTISIAFIPMDKCISIPDIPASLNATIPFKSFKSSCTQNADGSISTSNKVYATSSTCGGLGVPVKEDIPAGCNTGGTVQCVADLSAAPAIVNKWPAIGEYLSFTKEVACTSFYQWYFTSNKTHFSFQFILIPSGQP